MSKFSSNKIENMYLWGAKCIIFLIPFIPLYISSSLLFPYITGKNFAFRILVEFAAVLWLGLMFMNKEYRLQNSLMVSSVLIFTFVVGLADIFGVSPYNSFWSNYERMEGYITILHLALFFMIIKSILKTRKDWMIFFSIYLAASMLVSLYTFVEPVLVTQPSGYIAEYGIRRAGTIGNPLFLASYLLLSVFLGLILINMTQKTYLKLFCLFPIIINSIVIYITASRGAILAAFIGVFIIGVFLVFRKLRNSDDMSVRKVLPYIIGLLIISSVILLAYHNIDWIKQNRTVSRFMMMPSDPSVKTRLYAWKMAWNGIKENPVLGWGQENFYGVFTVNEIRTNDKVIWVDRAHNIVIEWLINAGLLGLFSYLAILGSAFYILKENLRKKLISENMVLIITTAVIVYFIQNLFTFDTINSYLIFFTLIAYIDNIESIKKNQCNNLEGNLNLKKTRIVFAGVTLFVLLVIAFISYLNYIPIKQLQSYTNMNRSLTKYDSFSAMLDDFNKALSYGSFGDDYIREEMYSVSRQIIENQLYENEGALKLIQRTAEELEKGLSTNRHNLEYITKAIYFYSLIAMYEPSYISVVEALIRECKRINPEYQRIEQDMVELFIIKKDYESAFNYMKKIAESQPESAFRQFKLAVTAILASRENIANEALAKAKRIKIAKNKEISDGKQSLFTVKQLFMLAQAYMEVKNFDKALQYYRRMITILPNDKNLKSLNNKDQLTVKAMFHLKIAEIYNLLADKENAIKEAEKAAKLDPDNYGDKAQYFIDSLNNDI